nr:PREDICTED: uncharacterized protein LOC109039620 [Bemisia tabaci]
MVFNRSSLLLLLLATFVATVVCECTSGNIESKSLDQMGETAKNDVNAFLKKLLTSYKDLGPEAKAKVAAISKAMEEQMKQIVNITKLDTKNTGKVTGIFG